MGWKAVALKNFYKVFAVVDSSPNVYDAVMNIEEALKKIEAQFPRFIGPMERGGAGCQVCWNTKVVDALWVGEECPCATKKCVCSWCWGRASKR